ncbi:MAG: hypothetical protein GY875_22915 [Gammaproteobacteria bacterium]|nr:hypothetical protein [Gammaproteobacteria bacterium]
MPRTSILKSIIASLLLAIPAAQADVLTFDEDLLFVHGTVVDDEYAPFVTISADNFTNSVDRAVAFDSASSPTRDDDLEAPFFPTQAELDQ